MHEPFPEDALTDLTLLALVIAHGADAELDPREVDTLADHLYTLAPERSGDEVIQIVQRGAEAYLDTRIEGAETVVYRLAGALDTERRRLAYEALCAVAEADQALHPIESALLRHVAAAWNLDLE